MMLINLLIYLVFVCIFNQINADYIISNELILGDDSEPGYELINLNKLTHKNSIIENQFKLVKDTNLVNYIDLIKDVLNHNTLVVLKKKINFDNICDSLTNDVSNCVQSLKIVAINENDFIELPIRLQHRQLLLKKAYLETNTTTPTALTPTTNSKSKLKIKFNQTNLTLTANLQYNIFTIDAASIFVNDDISMNKKFRKRLDQFNLDELNKKIDYRATPLDNQASLNEFNLILTKLNDSSKLKLNAFFLSQQSLQNALNEKKKFNYLIEAYLPLSVQTNDLRTKLGLIKNSSIQIEIKVEEPDETNELNMFKPLDFEYPIYTTVIMDNLTANTLVLQPKIKDALNNSQIICSLIQNNKTQELPFYLDEENCSILLKQDTYELITQINKEESYSFSLKATYKNLKNTSKLINYYYDYMIPAFAKIEIKVKHEPAKPPVINYETILTRHELINETKSIQTIILNINEPIESDSKLIKLIINENRKYQFEWIFDKMDPIFKFNKANKILIVSNRIELQDRSVYKTSLQLREKLKSSLGQVLKEIKLEIRVDYDPLIFENDEYSLLISETNILYENLIRIATVQTRNTNKTTDVKYRIWNKNENDETNEINNLFQIDANTGWISARKQLNEKYSYFELTVIASNAEQQKTASVKIKINIECKMLHKKVNEKYLKFNVYENLPKKTMLASIQTICSNMDLTYEISKSFTAKLCSKALLSNKIFSNDDELSCNYFNLNNSSDLISLDYLNGNILTNGFSNTSLFLSTWKNDDMLTYLNDEDFRLKLNFKMFARNSNDFLLNFNVDLSIQSAPKLLNFNEHLGFIDTTKVSNLNHTSEELSPTSSCLFNYKFLNDKEVDSNSDLIRFVRIDQNSGHLQAEFKEQVSNCRVTSFLINNNGCLSLKYDDKKTNCLNESDSELLLKSGSYNIEFKLCYYDNNKVSCSVFYNQKIHLEKDLLKSSKFITRILEIDSQSNQNEQHSSKTTGHLLLKSIKSNFYILIALILILVATLIVILILSIKVCKYFKNRKLYKSPELAYVLPAKKCIKIENSEMNTDSDSNHSRVHINNNQIETNSEAATSSSKLSNDENDEVVKIRVSDDYFSNERTNQNFVYINSNLGYAGSFSSIDSSGRGSSCLSADLKQFTQLKSKPINCSTNQNSPKKTSEETLNKCYEVPLKQQGIYSVKNASIQYKLNQSSIDETLSNITNDQKVIQLIENIYGVNTLNSFNFNNPNSIFYNSFNTQSSNERNKTDSKETNISSSSSSNQVNKVATSSFSSSSNSSPNDKRNLIDNYKNKINYSSSEIMLHPKLLRQNSNEVIASVV